MKITMIDEEMIKRFELLSKRVEALENHSQQNKTIGLNANATMTAKVVPEIDKPAEKCQKPKCCLEISQKVNDEKEATLSSDTQIFSKQIEKIHSDYYRNRKNLRDTLFEERIVQQLAQEVEKIIDEKIKEYENRYASTVYSEFVKLKQKLSQLEIK